MAKTDTVTTEAEAPKATFGELKKAIMQFGVESGEIGEFDGGGFYVELKSKEAAAWLKDLAVQLTAGAERGLPVAVRLERAQNERNEHYKAVKLGANGLPNFTPEWITKNDELTRKIDRLLREKKAADKKAESSPEKPAQ